ncbi:MAG: YkvA family protein [Synechococcales bacterium]|nr:YkvA family protein [Synechococcales bacterium]
MSNFSLEAVYNWYRSLVANPKYRWWVIAGTLVYLLSPFDISPDFIPFIGQVDDAIVVTLLATELAQVLRDRSRNIKQKQEAQPDQPVTVAAVEVK